MIIHCPYCAEEHNHPWTENDQGSPKAHSSAPCRNRTIEGINGAGYFIELPQTEKPDEKDTVK
ncbi:hypothetical protein GCM10007173_34880 [Glutamicibacter ardleyensis]|uniref:Uncharacterized protein n=1 Tax=Glutamicibacter ardleyensis TaxID=225894 RepID=A0ABQ2DV30_9MICC|nr:hypothetical protein GCM10007173_34880 [Glutamicibacter ardleyensis]